MNTINYIQPSLCFLDKTNNKINICNDIQTTAINGVSAVSRLTFTTVGSNVYPFITVAQANTYRSMLKKVATIDIRIFINGTEIVDLKTKADILNNISVCEHKTSYQCKLLSDRNVTQIINVEKTKQEMMDKIRNLSSSEVAKLATSMRIKTNNIQIEK